MTLSAEERAVRNRAASRKCAARRRANGQSRAYKRFKITGLSEAHQRALFETQGGRCAVCGCALEFSTANLDHDHATGKARGFLCWNDNISIGYMKDDPARLERAAAYLRKHGRP